MVFQLIEILNGYSLLALEMSISKQTLQTLFRYHMPCLIIVYTVYILFNQHGFAVMSGLKRMQISTPSHHSNALANTL